MPLAEVYHADLWGDRDQKYEILNKATLTQPLFHSSAPKEPHYHFAVRDYDLESQYGAGMSLNRFFIEGVLGFQTHRDKFAIDESEKGILDKLRDYLDLSITDDELHKKYGTKDNRDWKLATQRARLKADLRWNEKVTKCLYRPFDTKHCHLDYVMMDYPRTEIVRNMLGRDNLSLLASRQLATEGYYHCLVSDLPAESCAISLKTKEQNQVFPLYLYPSESELDQTRRVNFDQKLWKKLRGLAKDKTHGEPDEIATFDYIYGVLHCPEYRETYAEFLKSDFPRIPWPSSPDEFWRVAETGGMLRRLHLMESDAVCETPYPFRGDGDNLVEKPRFEKGKVFINATQYFDNVPEVSWNFFIGGYQPAQKWLKDRKGRALTFDDVKHYQKIVKILAETDRIMKTIEMDLSGEGEPQN